MPYFLKLSDFINAHNTNIHNLGKILMKAVWDFTLNCKRQYGNEDIGVNILLYNIPGLQLHPDQYIKEHEYYTPDIVGSGFRNTRHGHIRSNYVARSTRIILEKDTVTDENRMLNDRGRSKLREILRNFYTLSIQYGFYHTAFIHITCDDDERFESIMRNGLFSEAEIRENPEYRIGTYEPSEEETSYGHDEDAYDDEYTENTADFDWSYFNARGRRKRKNHKSKTNWVIHKHQSRRRSSRRSTLKHRKK